MDTTDIRGYPRTFFTCREVMSARRPLWLSALIWESARLRRISAGRDTTRTTASTGVRQHERPRREAQSSFHSRQRAISGPHSSQFR